jgi:hypothetical protein
MCIPNVRKIFHGKNNLPKLLNPVKVGTCSLWDCRQGDQMILWKKIFQTAAQPIFWSKLLHNLQCWERVALKFGLEF